MDTDERVCYTCLEKNEIQNYGPPYSMANPSGDPKVHKHPLGPGFAHKDAKKGVQDDPEC
jgi:hypothetical protein